MTNLYIISFIVIMLSLIVFYLKNTINDKRLIIILLFIYGQIWAISSVFYSEYNNSFSIELNKEMHYNGASFWYLLFMVAFIIFFKIGMVIYDKIKLKSRILNDVTKKDNTNKENIQLLFIKIGYLLFLILTLISLADIVNSVMQSGIGNRNHYKYVENIKRYPFIKYTIITIQNYLVYPILFITPGILKKLNRFFKTLIGINIALIVIYFILRGDKFGVYINSIVFALSGIILVCDIKKLNIKKILKLGIPSVIVLFLALYGSVYLNYSKKYNYDFNQTNQFILNRTMILQGQVWWATYDMNLDEKIDNKINRINNDFFSKDNDASGLKSIMRSIAPKNIVDRYEKDGVRFSTGSPAIFIYYFGRILGLTIFSFAGILLAFMACFIVDSINKGMFASALFLSAYFINGVLSELYLQGSFYGLYSKMAILMIVGYIAQAFLTKYFANRCNRH
ncbi:DUF6418 domain-containing protein [Clostridium sp. C8]|uniref:DUF6418 domain-containing protein n=1 Tax=Clostridium sp. C8 TaxID=1667357 RepID=UPI00062E3E7E|nr:DUF6418 domain-containing protein [Clostridium sp. C8]KLE14645.1 hypothetical protein AAT22_15715 [Clostridium sp. C8]